MSCNTCTKKFNIFTSEHGCPSCGFSFCSKCLKHTAFIIKLNKTEKVCSRCKIQENSAKNVENAASRDVQNFSKLLPGDEMSASATPSSSKLPNKVDPDKDLAERLKKLKENKDDNKISAVTDVEIKRRLALLKDENPEMATKPNTSINTVDLRSEEEKVQDLMTQAIEECQIDKSHNSIDEQLTNRLNNLRGELAAKGANYVKESGTSDDEEDMEKQINNILQRYKAEAELVGDSEEEFEKSNSEEFPWCAICNADASLRCLDCDGDLFCSSCFKESHIEWNYPDHRTQSYKPQMIS